MTAACWYHSSMCYNLEMTLSRRLRDSLNWKAGYWVLCLWVRGKVNLLKEPSWRPLALVHGWFCRIVIWLWVGCLDWRLYWSKSPKISWRKKKTEITNRMENSGCGWPPWALISSLNLYWWMVSKWPKTRPEESRTTSSKYTQVRIAQNRIRPSMRRAATRARNGSNCTWGYASSTPWWESAGGMDP